jgi:peptidoglycan/xylan/chitin deacetylase (PgdA/CDA1 family)
MAFSWAWPVAQDRDAAALAADFCAALGLCAPRPVAQPSLLIHDGPRDSAKIALTFDMGGRVSSAQIVDRVLGTASGGSIVLMHLAGYKSAAALPSVIDGLRARGFELVTVSELLGSS